LVDEEQNMMKEVMNVILEQSSKIAEREVKREIGEEKIEDYKKISRKIDMKMYRGKTTIEKGVKEYLQRLNNKGIVHSKDEFLKLYDIFSENKIDSIEDIIEEERKNARTLDMISVTTGMSLEELIDKMHQ
jgi:hypothetical protein